MKKSVFVTIMNCLCFGKTILKYYILLNKKILLFYLHAVTHHMLSVYQKTANESFGTQGCIYVYSMISLLNEHVDKLAQVPHSLSPQPVLTQLRPTEYAWTFCRHDYVSCFPCLNILRFELATFRSQALFWKMGLFTIFVKIQPVVL